MDGRAGARSVIAADLRAILRTPFRFGPSLEEKGGAEDVHKRCLQILDLTMMRGKERAVIAGSLVESLRVVRFNGKELFARFAELSINALDVHSPHGQRGL